MNKQQVSQSCAECLSAAPKRGLSSLAGHQSRTQSLLASYCACSTKTKDSGKNRSILRRSWLVLWNVIQYNKSAICGLLGPVLSRALHFRRACAVRLARRLLVQDWRATRIIIMENDGSWTLSGYKEAMEVPDNLKDLRKLGIRTCHFQCYFVLPAPLLPYSAIFTGVCGPFLQTSNINFHSSRP